MEHIPGYDGWKLATPWDDEVAMTVSFDCESCEEFNDAIETVGSRNSHEVYAECEYCEAENCVDVGPDE
jgi:hypothetical protein